jgi:hypothetical protein
MAERQKLPQAVGDAIDWTLNYAEVRKYGDPPYEEEVIELDDKLKSEYISKLNSVPLKGNDPQDQAHPLRKT